MLDFPLPPALAPGRAAVSLVEDNRRAFLLRVAACREATRSLDLMYYAWHGDVSGRCLAREVWEAAGRGVRVRLLLDDLHVLEAEFGLAALARHPNVEARLYNPYPFRRLGAFGALLTTALAKRRLNHRMHNKAWVMDGRLVIGGGRNIGDEYFGTASRFNFRDLDLAVEGERHAREAVAVFDRYWASRRVRPIGEVLAMPARAALPEANADGAVPPLAGLLAEGRVELDETRVRLVADPPRKGFARRRGGTVLSELRALMRGAREEVLLVSPYFVPGGRGARVLGGLARAGVRVAVVTNSLAATDVLAVHGGYARYRRRLLRAGVALHELKRWGQEGESLFGSSGAASLHTKALVVDGRVAFVGSFNFDPRSAHLNTEMGAVVEDERLAARVRAEFERLADPAHSWRVELDGLNLRWRDGEGVSEGEPGAPWHRVALARALGWLPIEPHL
jgi:putative cardiolipin synthase